jgi:hypothetical protein
MIDLSFAVEKIHRNNFNLLIKLRKAIERQLRFSMLDLYKTLKILKKGATMNQSSPLSLSLQKEIAKS